MHPHAAVVLEQELHRLLATWLRRRGWVEGVIGYTGYGSAAGHGEFVRVLARVVLVEADGGRTEAAADATATDAELDEASGRRGWRNFVTTPASFVPVEVEVGNARHTTSSDRSGYVDVELTDHGLGPGWHEATVTSRDGARVHADVRIVDPAARVGIVSDVDDTVLVTHLPRPLVAAWNTFVKWEVAREAVPGMADLAQFVLRRFPHAPVVYLSTGAWNVAPTLVRFLRRNGFPAGPLLLTDWGPTNTGWFRSGRDHKRRSLQRLRREFPEVEWILVGDDGQHDPAIYREFAARHPSAVRAIAIRTLTTAEQVLSHGFPGPKDPTEAARAPSDADVVVRAPGDDEPGVPVLRGPDGHALRDVLAAYDAHRYGPAGPPVGRRH